MTDLLDRYLPLASYGGGYAGTLTCGTVSSGSVDGFKVDGVFPLLGKEELMNIAIVIR